MRTITLAGTQPNDPILTNMYLYKGYSLICISNFQISFPMKLLSTGLEALTTLVQHIREFFISPKAQQQNFEMSVLQSMTVF